MTLNVLVFKCVCKYQLILSGFVRVRLSQAKSVFLKKVEKRQAKSVFLFKNLTMSVFLSTNASKFLIKNY